MAIKTPEKKAQYTCPDCKKKWLYSPLELKFAKQDGCCHQCEGAGGEEDYPANDGGMGATF
jgi:hypothetical protein